MSASTGLWVPAAAACTAWIRGRGDCLLFGKWNLFFFTALLRCKSHTLKSAHVKCTILWFVVHSYSCAINFGTFSGPQRETHTSQPSPPIPLTLGSHPPIDFLCLPVHLPILGTIQQLVFVTGFFFSASRFQGSSVLGCESGLHSFSC